MTPTFYNISSRITRSSARAYPTVTLVFPLIFQRPYIINRIYDTHGARLDTSR